MKVYIYNHVQYYIKIRPCFVPQNVQMKGKKVFFEDPQSVTSQSRIKYDGIPFIITGKRVYDCHQGIDRHAADKERRNTSKVIFTFFSVKDLCRGGGEREKRRGGQGCFRLARGGANFFQQLMGGGGHDFLGFARGLVCAFANGITFTK